MLIWNWAKPLRACLFVKRFALLCEMQCWSLLWIFGIPSGDPHRNICFLQKVKPQFKKQYSITFVFFKVLFNFFLIWDLIFRQDYKLWWKISKAELLSGVHKGFLSHNSMNRSISAARIWTIRGSTDFSQSILTVVAALCLGFIIWGICF